MASGERPLWGDGRTDPLTNESAELHIAGELFHRLLQSGLTAFFRRALHRDIEHRFDTLRQMKDAWQKVFRDADSDLPPTTPSTVGSEGEDVEQARDRAALAAGAETELEVAGLSPRAVTVAAGLGATTVGQLLEIQPSVIHKTRGAGPLVRKELNRRRSQWAAALRGKPAAAAVLKSAASVKEGGPEAGVTGILSVDDMAGLLTPAPGRKSSHRVDVVRLTLGLPTEDGGLSALGAWPVQARIADHLDIKQPPVSRHHRAEIKRWAEAEWLRPVCTELVEIVANFGRVMTSPRPRRSCVLSTVPRTTHLNVYWPGRWPSSGPPSRRRPARRRGTSPGSSCTGAVTRCCWRRGPCPAPTTRTPTNWRTTPRPSERARRSSPAVSPSRAAPRWCGNCVRYRPRSASRRSPTPDWWRSAPPWQHRSSTAPSRAVPA
ncbi:hypothetical protein AB0932_28745 [Streptomyces sp. NPDC006682]|uniref:hypothetical protein n=1 Tax=Streptomyces TaxID=1883 RepID=UPI00193246D3|nr:hypothetical protein [Streptomyces pratensis]